MHPTEQFVEPVAWEEGGQETLQEDICQPPVESLVLEHFEDAQHASTGCIAPDDVLQLICKTAEHDHFGRNPCPHSGASISLWLCFCWQTAGPKCILECSDVFSYLFGRCHPLHIIDDLPVDGVPKGGLDDLPQNDYNTSSQPLVLAFEIKHLIHKQQHNPKWDVVLCL